MGTSPAHYRDFAAEALAAGDGLFLDAGCGTASATASFTEGRLARWFWSTDRLTCSSEPPTASQWAAHCCCRPTCWIFPSSRGTSVTVACFGVLHVLDDPWAALKALRDQLASGGRIFESYVPRALAGLSRSLPWKVAMMVLRPRPRRRELRILTVSR